MALWPWKEVPYYGMPSRRSLPGLQASAPLALENIPQLRP